MHSNEPVTQRQLVLDFGSPPPLLVTVILIVLLQLYIKGKPVGREPEMLLKSAALDDQARTL